MQVVQKTCLSGSCSPQTGQDVSVVAGGVGQRAHTTAAGLAEQATRGHALVPQTPRSAGGCKPVKRVRLVGKPCVELEAAVAARDASDESHNHPHVPGREAACVAWVVAGRTRHILASHGPAGTKAPEQSSHFVIAHNVAVHGPRGARKPSQVGQYPVKSLVFRWWVLAQVLQTARPLTKESVEGTRGPPQCSHTTATRAAEHSSLVHGLVPQTVQPAGGAVGALGGSVSAGSAAVASEVR